MLDGVHFIFLLQWYPREICGQVLSCLSDMCISSDKFKEHIVSWRGTRRLPTISLAFTNFVSVPEEVRHQVLNAHMLISINDGRQSPSLAAIMCWLWRRHNHLKETSQNATQTIGLLRYGSFTVPQFRTIYSHKTKVSCKNSLTFRNV